MKVYRLDWFDRISGNRVQWFPNQRYAKQRSIEIANAYEHVGEIRVTPVDLPRSRSRLIEWLNQNLQSANV